MCLNGISMNPDQNPYPVDYLNQIAPEQPKQGMNNKMFFLLIGGGLLVAAVVGILALSGGSNGPTQKMQRLAARLTTLQTVASDAQRNIKSGQLRSTNSTLTIFLTNANRDIAEPLSKNSVDIKKIDTKITASENGEKLKTTLEDARLNATFDRTYAREMSYQLETVAALMKDIYTNTNSKSLKTFLEATDTNLQPIKLQLAEFNAANG
jgi:outer membrane murein-binding lipoprotein Lpp